MTAVLVVVLVVTGVVSPVCAQPFSERRPVYVDLIATQTLQMPLLPGFERGIVEPLTSAMRQLISSRLIWFTGSALSPIYAQSYSSPVSFPVDVSYGVLVASVLSGLFFYRRIQSSRWSGVQDQFNVTVTTALILITLRFIPLEYDFPIRIFFKAITGFLGGLMLRGWIHGDRIHSRKDASGSSRILKGIGLWILAENAIQAQAYDPFESGSRIVDRIIYAMPLAGLIAITLVFNFEFFYKLFETVFRFFWTFTITCLTEMYRLPMRMVDAVRYEALMMNGFRRSTMSLMSGSWYSRRAGVLRTQA